MKAHQKTGAHYQGRITFLDPSSPEWSYLWSQLGPDPEQLDARSGECWQYMGTVLPPDGAPYHEMRHRMHPTFRRRIVRKYAASPFFDVSSHCVDDLAELAELANLQPIGGN